MGDAAPGLLVPLLALRADLLRRTEQGVEAFPVADQVRLLGQLTRKAVQSRRGADAQRLRTRRNALEPVELPSAVLLLDFALADGDDAAHRPGPGPFASTGGRRRHLARLRRSRPPGPAPPPATAPPWPAPERESGSCASVVPPGRVSTGWKALSTTWKGASRRPRRPIGCAFDLGERHPLLIQTLVQRLLEHGRFAEADQVLTLSERQTSWNADQTRRAAAVALQAGNRERAIALAHRAVPAGSDWQDRLWLADLLSRADKPDDAETVFRQAVAASPPAVLDAWVVFAAHLARRIRMLERDNQQSAADRLRGSR